MISKRDGDWWVTTPLYVGDQGDIMRMSLCEHPRYETARLAEVHAASETGEKIEMGLEKCVDCGATRSRYRYPDPERNRLP